MAKKPTSTKKTAAKKTNTKPAAKATARRAKPIAQAKAKPKTKAKPTSSARKTTATKPTTKPTALSTAIRRPDPNLPPDKMLINDITDEILYLITMIDSYTANLRALDRKRHNGVGIKRLGFIEAAFRISSKFPQYFPHWLDTAKFQRDLDLFNAIRSLVEVCRSLEEKAWNINVEAADMVYTNALEYYSQVKDAAERRIDAAESLYKEMHEFFNRMGPHENPDQPTKKKAKKDFNAILDGKKDGKIVVENIRPKTTGGKREIIDETFRDKAAFKDTEEGSIN